MARLCSLGASLGLFVAVGLVTTGSCQTLRGAGAERSASTVVGGASNADMVVDGSSDIILPWSQKEEMLGAKHINLKMMANDLAFELSGASKARVDEFRLAMQPFYAAWPKDADGRVEHQTARYVLHRLFVQRHNWFFTGLEHNGDVWQQNTASKDSVKEWVPEYMLELMEKQLGSRGLDLNDLAALAAAIEDLVYQEVEGSMREVYQALRLDNETDKRQMHAAISAYMVTYLGNGAWPLQAALTDEFARKHSYWKPTEEWFSELEAKQVGDLRVDGKVDFAAAAQVVKDIGASYGAYNHGECQKLKSSLLNMWSKGNSTGRVRLVDFYRLGLDSEFGLIEKPAFLRAIGALDESNASSPMVIVPNYLSAKPNCLQATAMYSICCRNECDDLMFKIEAEIAAPTASAARIINLVSSLKSATVDAPRELPRRLSARLEEIAAVHGGEVNLHGRLFAQWMHHAFPSECPFPHEAGTSDPVSPDEWKSGSIEESEEERKRRVDDDTCGPEQAAAEWNAELPWSETEELLSSEARAKVQTGASAATSWLQTACCALLLMVAILGLALIVPSASTQEQQKCLAFIKHNSRLIVLTIIMLVLLATNMVDRLLVFLICGSGLAVRLLATSMGTPVKVLEKEKCLV